MRLNLRQIEAFRCVYQTGSMTLAGEMMGVSQPAISRLIRDLEAEVDFPLFERTRGRLTPTRNATAFYREVQRSFHGLDRLGRVAEDLRQRRAGDLRIAATVASSFYLLPAVIQRFREDWPDVKIALHGCASPEVLECVASQQYDIGIAVTPTEAPGVRAYPLPKLDTVCVMPEDHPLAAKDVIGPQDLDGAPLLLISEYSSTQQRVLRSLEDAGAHLNVVMEATYSAPICEAIRRGAGVAVLEPVTVRSYEGDGLVARPYRPAIPVELNLIAAGDLSARAEAFYDLVKEEMATYQAAA